MGVFQFLGMASEAADLEDSDLGSVSELLSEDGSGGGSFHTNTSTVSSHTHADVLSQRSCTLTPHNSRAVESKSAETVFSTHKTEVLRKKLSGPFRDACTSSSASDVHPSLARLVQTLRGRMDKEHVSKELRKQTPPGQQLSHTLARQTERLKIEVIKHKLEAQIKEVDVFLESEQGQSKDELGHIAENEFVRLKMNLLSKHTLTTNLENYLQRDPLTLLGEVVGSCVRPSASSAEVWQALSQRMQSLKTGQRNMHPQ